MKTSTSILCVLAASTLLVAGCDRQGTGSTASQRMDQSSSKMADATSSMTTATGDTAITAKVKAVSRDGDAWVQWTFDRAWTLPPKEKPDAEPPSNRFFEQIGVVSGTGTLSPRGVASDVALSRSGPRENNCGKVPSATAAVTAWPGRDRSRASAPPSGPARSARPASTPDPRGCS